MKSFLVVFDRSAGHLVGDVEEYPSRSEALEARFRREATERSRPNIEVVVLGAESFESLRTTHSRYFEQEVPA